MAAGQAVDPKGTTITQPSLSVLLPDPPHCPHPFLGTAW